MQKILVSELKPVSSLIKVSALLSYRGIAFLEPSFAYHPHKLLLIWLFRVVPFSFLPSEHNFDSPLEKTLF